MTIDESYVNFNVFSKNYYISNNRRKMHHVPLRRNKASMKNFKNSHGLLSEKERTKEYYIITMKRLKNFRLRKKRRGKIC